MFWRKKKKTAASAENAPVAVPEQNEAKKTESIAPPPSAPVEGKKVNSIMLSYKEELAKIGPIPNGADDIDIEGIPKILDKKFYPANYPQVRRNHTCRFWEISFRDCGEKGRVLEESYYYKKGENSSLYDLYKLFTSILEDCPRVTHTGHQAGGSFGTGEGGVTEYYQTDDGNTFELWYDYDEAWGDSVNFCTKTDALGRLMLRDLRSIFEDYLGVPLQISIRPGSIGWWWRKVTITKAQSQPKES